MLVPRWLDEDREPRYVSTLRDSTASTDEALRERSPVDGDEDALRHPPACGVAPPQERLHLPVDMLGRLPERELAQGCQVARLEVAPERALGLLGDVDLAFPQALEELLRREIDELHLVRAVEDPVWDRLAHPDTGDLRDDVVQALEVLDVHGRVDVDARIEQLLDVLEPLVMAAAGRVRVRELVDDDERGTAREQP